MNYQSHLPNGKTIFSILLFLLSLWIAPIVQAQSSTCGEELSDVVIMLDRSSSIDRTTELPAEAAAAKALLDTFTTLGLGNKVAVGAFSNFASILPGGNLTTDYASLKTVIDDYLDDTVDPGTNLEDAVQVSETELNTGANPLKFILLISDGQATWRNTLALTDDEAALQAAQTAKDNGNRIITLAYDSSDGSSDAIDGRTLLAAMASNSSDDDTSGSVDSTESDLENSDGDDFYIAPDASDLRGIFEDISDTISCDDGNTCTLDSCDETSRACSYTANDYDADGTADCSDACDTDSNKTQGGQCGCNVADTDSDFDGTADCNDLCASDSDKIAPGTCGCGTSDDDTDGDGTLNCQDLCPSDSDKTAAGICGCGTADTDSDGDGTADCQDECSTDAAKIEAGVCGCGVTDSDADQNGICDNEEVVTPDPSVGGTVCDVTVDANADGLPDDLDPALDDANADGTPDCCTSGNADNTLLNYDSDGDGISNCREFAIGTNPTDNDVSFQGSATDLSFSNCSLAPSATKSGKTDVSTLLFAFALISLALLRTKKTKLSMKPILVILIVMVSLGLSTSSYAINAQGFSPSDGIGSGYGLYTSQTLTPGQIAVGSFFNYAQHPLELGRINNDPRVLGVVDRFVTADVIATIGVFNHVNLTANMPINLYHDIAPTLIPNRDRGGPDAGDLRISSKIQFVDADNSLGHWGFAAVPFVTLPTGDESRFLGDDGVTGGGIVVGEKKFGPDRLYANLGARFKKQERLGNLVVDDAMTYGAGYQHQFSEAHAISGIAEVQGSTTLRKFFNDEISSPLEARAILQKDFLQTRNLHTYIGGGMGLTNGISAPDFRINTGISVTINTKHNERAAKK